MNSETKRHIDAARQVLVGVVPNPTSQIEQITNALIYKFMDDMDQSAIKVGGEPSFFVDDLEQYSWTRLMSSRIGNQERMNIYAEALVKFSQAKQLPELFRDIFKSAFLPYRSPETLGLFLKEINYFDYSHPEELGNAYEYLLSIMSSQGDAGQFRTPRHIIDFMVDVINPTKDDKVLDPACGTGGFLVMSYKHILEQHDGINEQGIKEKPLTPDDRKKLMSNFEGYDIDPTMVRIAQVNMYLHQFKNPKIYQYDSLSQDEKWNDKFDVILANPPFMSPKGGIKPHSKFSIPSNRSEVLFVDYIVNHLRPEGRAGIIVPEGVIFQSGNAYKALRKSLVEDGLYAVVSLPSGVFSPYSGVKTSILLFNNKIAKLSKEILFVKVENDGFDLGATKRPINKNDLPNALLELRAYQVLLESGKPTTSLTERIKKENKPDTLALLHDKFILAKKFFIAESGSYDLTGDHYKPAKVFVDTKWPTFKLRDLEEAGDITLGRGKVISKKDIESNPGIYPVYSSSAQGSGEFGQYGEYMFDEELITWSVDGGGRFFYRPKHKFSVTNVSGWLRINHPEKINAKYLFRILHSEWLNKNFDYVAKAHPSVIRELYFIPLPPLDIQEKIVKQLDEYVAIINGAKQIVANWKPKINIDPKWEKVKLPSISENKDRQRKPVTKSDRSSGKYPYYGASGIVDYVDDYIFDGDYLLISEDGANLLARSTPIAFSITGKNWVNNHAHVLKFKNENTQKFVEVYINQIDISEFVTGMAQPKLNQQALNSIEIPLPSPEIQKQIVEKIEAERESVDSARKLIRIYEDKTNSALEKLYGHDN